MKIHLTDISANIGFEDGVGSAVSFDIAGAQGNKAGFRTTLKDGVKIRTKVDIDATSVDVRKSSIAEMQRMIRNDVKDTFRSEGAISTYSKWATLAAMTQKTRNRKGYGKAHPILQNEGELYRLATTGELVVSNSHGKRNADVTYSYGLNTTNTRSAIKAIVHMFGRRSIDQVTRSFASKTGERMSWAKKKKSLTQTRLPFVTYETSKGVTKRKYSPYKIYEKTTDLYKGGLRSKGSDLSSDRSTGLLKMPPRPYIRLHQKTFEAFADMYKNNVYDQACEAFIQDVVVKV